MSDQAVAIRASSSGTGLVTVREAVVDLLRQSGMTTVFGNPGSTELALYRDWPDDLDYVLGLQEASVLAMADGFAQITGRPTLVHLHSAPGMGNAMGSMVTAYRGGSPLVVLVGQQARAMLPWSPYLTAAGTVAMATPFAKFGVEPSRAEDVPAALAQAWQAALMPPTGPALVVVPADDWERHTHPVELRQVHGEVTGDRVALRGMGMALKAAQRPLIIVGPGIDREVWTLMVALAERLAAPVVASPVAHRCGFPEHHPLFAGHLEPTRSSVAGALAGHDVAVVLGAPVFRYHVDEDGPVVPVETRLYQLTDDPTAAACARVGETILTSLRWALREVLSYIPRRSKPLQFRRPTLTPPTIDPITANQVMATIRETMPEDAVVVETAASHRRSMHTHLPITRPCSFFSTASGGLGWAIPAAVGISLAEFGRRVVCLVGDGDSLYSIQALWTAAQRRLPVTVVVLNNGGYGILRAFAVGIDAPGLDLPGLDLCAIAQGFGVEALRVEAAASLRVALQQAMKSHGPVLLDIVVADTITDPYGGYNHG